MKKEWELKKSSKWFEEIRESMKKELELRRASNEFSRNRNQ